MSRRHWHYDWYDPLTVDRPTVHVDSLGRVKHRRPIMERFMSMVEVAPSGCWNWSGSRQTTGYGTFYPNRTTKCVAHRAAYLIFKGPIPDRLDIDHLCRNRSCVNPDHLEPVSSSENHLRAFNHLRARTYCNAGHPFDDANTIRRTDNPYGGRRCRTCTNARRRNARRREAALS